MTEPLKSFDVLYTDRSRSAITVYVSVSDTTSGRFGGDTPVTGVAPTLNGIILANVRRIDTKRARLPWPYCRYYFSLIAVTATLDST